ncbi:MAG TPA: PQQ-dependent sugar dehydrogenase, partial [Solirubrobacterales bacterium]|nr:PQQ-dependent sugar dehydrogenase [Solirubrobacterales bacterium]
MDEARRRGGCGRRIATVFLVALAWLCLGSTAVAETLHPIGSFKRPIFVTSDPGDQERLLVVEREGRVVETGPGGTRTYADLSSLVTCCESERGLLSIAPAPDFHSSGRFYAAYTGKAAAGGLEGDVHVDSFRPDPQTAGQLIREPILSVAHSQEANHNGGQLQFGPDGHLYVSLGDGGGGGDPFENGQDLEELLAKILRIDPRPGQSPAYAIPAGNPFAAGPGRDEIWAYGLRNPWRFSFDYLNGDMVIADVGQDAREEVDFAPAVGGALSGAGADYGWSCREGFIAYTSPAANCAGKSGFVDPVFDYPHEDPGGGAAYGCSIIGGYVVRDQSVPDLYGRYVYADYCTGQLRSLVLPSTSSGTATDDRVAGLHVSKPTSFGEDSCGRVYVAS